jgi:hypothetical protein
MREVLGRVLDGIDDEPLRLLVEEAFRGQSTKNVWHAFACDKCGKKQKHEVAVEVPSAKLSERVKALTALLDQAKGRPAEQRKVTVDVTVRALEDLRSLSDGQLAAIASGAAAVEDGDWVPLELTAGDGAG